MTSTVNTPAATPWYSTPTATNDYKDPLGTNTPTSTYWPSSTPSNTPTASTTPTPYKNPVTPYPVHTPGNSIDISKDIAKGFGDLIDYLSEVPPMPGDPPPAIPPNFELIPQSLKADPYYGRYFEALDIGLSVVGTGIDLVRKGAIPFIFGPDLCYPLPYPVPYPGQ